MAGRIVGGSRETIRAVRIRHGSFSAGLCERTEFTEPPGDDRPKHAVRWDPKKAVAFAKLTVLVAPAHDEGALQPLGSERDRDGVDGVIRVDQQLGSHPHAGCGDGCQVWHDVGGAKQDGRHQHRRGAVVHRCGEAGSDLTGGLGGDRDHLDAFFRQASELPSNGMVLSIGRQQPGSCHQRQRGQESHHELVRTGAQRDDPVVIAEQGRPPTPDTVRDRERPLPLVIHQVGGILPRTDLSVESHVRPRLMRVSCEKQPLADAKP